MSYHKILDRILDSNDFGVGGGSAAALSGGMAAAIAAMVANLSLKKDFGMSSEKYLEIAKEAEELSQILLIGAEKDAVAYAAIKEAFSLPKETEEEKAKRKTAIQNGMVGAAIVPKDNAWNCRRVQEICIELEGKSNPAARSDLAVARFLADLGVMGCVLNIEVNVESIKDPDKSKSLQEEVEKLRKFVNLPN